MKPAPLIALATTVLLAAGCNSLDNPLAGLNPFDTGHDARVYNQQTGEFEWPKDQQGRPKRGNRSSAVSSAIAGANTPAPNSDGRYFDSQKNQWIEPPPQSNAANEPRRPKPAATPTPAPGASVPMRTPVPRATPPPPPPSKASGVYNSSTGQIEWRETSGPPMATPNPKSHWWKFWGSE